MQKNAPIALPVGELKPALTGLSKIINRSTQLPVFRSIRLHRDTGGWITLRGTDTEVFATARIEAPSPGPESTILVPLSDLSDVAKRCGSNDTVTVADTGESIEIACPLGGQSLVHRTERIDPAEFPVAPVTDTQPRAIEDAVRVALLEALDCASTDETRFILQGAYLDVAQSTGHYIIGTDGRHLYSANTFKLPIEASVIIPAHRFLHWKPFAADGEWRIRVFQTGPDKNPWISLCSRRWDFSVRQVEGTYPNYRQVIPADEAFTTSIRLDEEGVKFAIDALGKLPGADQHDKPVAIRIENRKASFGSRPPADASWIELLGATVTGADVQTMLNRSFLLKALTIGLTQIDIASPCDPLRFRQGGRQIVAMPLRTGDAASEPAPASTQQPEPAETAPQPPAQPKEKTMTETNGHHTNGAATPHLNGANRSTTPVIPAAEKPAIEVAIEKLDAFKATFREALVGLTELTTLLKQSVREQKAGEKEIHQVRQTLRQLQNVKF